MQTFGENLNNWKVPWPLRYPIALAFKIVGRSRSIELAKELGPLYSEFINLLDITQELKNKLVKDLYNNWICNKWILSFIDAGRILENPSIMHIMTTNNYTERLNRTIESQYSGTRTVVNFIERLYGIQLLRENLTDKCSNLRFEAGLATIFDMQTIEQESQAMHIASDKLRRINHGRLLFLLDYVKCTDIDDYFYHLNKILDYLEHYEYYLINIKTGECTCFDYVWNGPFRDVCKHCHAASIFKESIGVSDLLLFKQEVKKELVQYFKNKQRVLPTESKNLVIYNGDVEAAYSEIIDLYKTHGISIFKSYSRPNENNKDPFQPVELDYHKEAQKELEKNIRDAKENIKNIKNPYKPLTVLPLQDTQSTIMQSYSRNDYIQPLLSVLQSIQTSIDFSYILSPTNLPISFPSTVPYYSNFTVPSNNCPPDQNPYSLSPTYLFNSSSFATSHNSSIIASAIQYFEFLKF
ncbi:hypothetical protein GLOIN_2v1870574 [Rhizophagus irregularis DAOM 181602=DAOM 197198]|uniref:SWIM-type domain-containing protein n=2 Tax=Rhizophagus irregularis TaxID=588596 RepID=A0A2P4QLK5_RHIID|nr:hypothetical protein GLOIN_2v1870574 [Rhizophagus irregularis DAOM 181602=DAOM 197198]POG78529.1 hypothetical protein GLOIN_2v1870574 [Rhizophagus irregularis DAOM 181602=DAOM 197198]|eukprot:XP_025185395.1 hypothetical protein GLOIN_2v1870574 [Rhizophagus irregularis DAOM 181602=DAOM 197198]